MAEVPNVRVVDFSKPFHLKSGGGDGTFDDMDHRVTKLEEKADRIVASLAEVRERLVAVEVKVDHLPTKDWITTRMQLYAALSVAAIGIITNLDKLV